MRSLFWLIAAALLAISTHLAYVLFVPPQNFGASVAANLQQSKDNTFTILAAKQQTQLLPFTSALDLVGFCKFDVAQSRVRFTMEVPSGYWTFSVYTMRGQQVYALNDKQADTSRFSVTLSKAASLLDQMGDGGGQEPDVLTDLGWRVSVSDPQGVAFLWMPHSDMLRRKEAERALSKSSCQPVTG